MKFQPNVAELVVQAVCRYSCEVSDRPAGCTDAQFDAKAQACCEAAFQNTPGIDQVPCTVGPDDV